jgi:transposase
MRKLKEVLRLHSLGLSQHQIARSCSISQSTVHEYVSAAQAVGVKWPLPDSWDEQQIEQALFPQRPAPAVWRKHSEPDWAKVHEELQTHKNLTLQLVWQEGRETDPEGYGYSWFCDLYLAMAEEVGPGAAAGAPRRREDVRRLRRCHDSDS